MGFQMKLNKEEIMNDIDHEKVSQAFGLFVISKLKDEQLGSLLSQFRELFFDVIRSKSKESQPNPNDIEMKQGMLNYMLDPKRGDEIINLPEL